MHGPFLIHRIAFVSLATILSAGLAGCGEEPDRAAAPSTAADTTPVHQAPADFTGPPAASVEELFAGLDAAIAAETSVHQEWGNLNPPPPAILDQEYGAAGTDLHHYVDLGPSEEDRAEMSAEDLAALEASPLVFEFCRSDGMVHGGAGGEVRSLPEEEVDEDTVGETVLATLRSDVRSDLARMAEAASGFAFVGEEEVGDVTTRHYRVVLDLDPQRASNPSTVPYLQSGRMPADVWVGTDGLPVRIDIDYASGEMGVPGTGVSRTDYSRWSVPVECDADDVDGERNDQ